MKKIVAVLLVMTLVLSGISAVSATETRTWGADNLNNNSGDLVIGFLGGSITEGCGAATKDDRWSTLVVNGYFKKNFPNKNVIERNASIGGTNSQDGMLRMRRNLELDSASTPDVVFVEFAVNDAGPGGMEISERMETVVRQLTMLPKIPVIIFVYTTSELSLNYGADKGWCVENAIAAFHDVAKTYGIFEVNLNDYVWSGIKAGKYSWSQNAADSLTGDLVHPNNAGHKVYADRVIEMLTANKSKAFKKLDPDTAPFGDYVFGELVEIPFDDESVKLKGNWEKVSYEPIGMDENINFDYYRRFFRNGYMKSENCSGAEFELEFTGRGIGIDYVRHEKNADLQYTVYAENGSVAASGSAGQIYYPGDTTRCCGKILVRNLPYGKYRFVGKAVAAGERNQLHMGYIAVEKAMPKIAPTAYDVKTSAAAEIGEPLSGSYKYSCKMYDEDKTKTEKMWYISDTEDGEYKAAASGDTYTPWASENGKYLKFGVKCVNSNGDSGKTVYSDAAKIVPATGKISVKNGISITVDGAPAENPGTGKNKFSALIENSGSADMTVNYAVAVYKENGGYKLMSGYKSVTKTIAAGKTVEFEIEITLTEDDRIVKSYAYACGSLEPEYLPLAASMTEVTPGDGGIPISVYNINYF